MKSKEYKDCSKMNVKTLRLKDSVIESVYLISKEKNLSESEYIRGLIEKDISEFKLKKAIEAYKKREINLSEGAEISGMSYREFLDELEKRKISLNMDGFSFEYGVKSIEKSLKK